MKDYIFILEKMDEDRMIIRKAMFFSSVEEHLEQGWSFSDRNDRIMYMALQNFYTVLNNDRNK